MLNHPTLDKLLELKLLGMAEAYKQQLQMPEAAKLSFDERFGLMVDAEFSDRDNSLFCRRLKAAKLRQAACIEDLDFGNRQDWRRQKLRGLRFGSESLSPWILDIVPASSAVLSRSDCCSFERDLFAPS
jgi:hypothetical protein